MRKSSFFRKIATHIESGLPVAVSRLPGKTTLEAYLQTSKETFQIKDFSEKGFVFAPFDVQSPAIYIPKAHSERLAAAPLSLKKTPILHTIREEGRLRFENLVEKALSHIASTQIKKVALARVLEVDFEQARTVDIFKNLLSAYPNAYVYLWFHPATGLWIGATPERFIQLKNKRLKTVSLAGTRLASKTPVPWTLKEIEEQQIVTAFIEEALRPYAKRYNVSDTKEARAGDLQHLKTKITADLKEKTRLAELVNALHPTPAVGGVPKAASIAFIRENEGFDRAYYTGFLGALNPQKGARLFVNIRCMRLENNRKGKLFVGAGITAGSDPQKEWDETQNKAATILRALSL